MNNKKGFTLVELIVSFALITTISLVFFKTILSLQQQQLENIARNNFKSFTIVLNNSIQKDFLNDNIEKIISCGENCYDITYTANGIVRLSVDKESGTITYGNIKEKLPNDYKFIGNIEFTSYINSYEGNDSYIALNLNLKSNYESKIENIKYLYQYDSDNQIIELDVDGAEASDIIEYLLYSSPEENGLYEPLLPDGTSTGIRYRGSNPNNYVYFNCEDTDTSSVAYGEDGYDYANFCEVWRIIGVFDVDNSKGNVEKRVKLVRNESLLDASWDSSSSTINIGSGINEWSESKLNIMLNTYYLNNSSICRYCNNSNQETCENSCENSFKKLSDTSINKIENVVWKTGAIEYSPVLPVLHSYLSERGNNLGNSICDSTKKNCNDSVVRKTEWVGKIGLIYPSDYAYASQYEGCHSDIVGADSTCKNINWLYNESSYWTITPTAYTGGSGIVVRVSDDRNILFNAAYLSYGVLPSLYLKSNVTFVGNGDGTEENPYILGINE